MQATKKGTIFALGGALVLAAFLSTTKDVHAGEIANETKIEGNILNTASWNNRAAANVKEYANIKEEENNESKTVGVLLPGHMAQVLEKTEAWSKVSSEGIIGYVENANLVFGEEARVHYKNMCGFDAKVNSEGVGLNVRNNADLKATVIDSLTDGSDITVDEQSGDWYQVTLDGTKGFIHKQYAVLDQEGEGAITEEAYKQHVAAQQAAAQQAAAQQAAAQQAATQQAVAQQEAAQQAVDNTPVASGRGVSLNAQEMNLLSALVQCEAGGESRTGKVAVAAVVINRMQSGVYPADLNTVVYQGGQFAPTWDGSLNSVLASGPRADCTEAVNAALAGENPIGSCLYFNSGAGQGMQIGNQHFY